MRGQIASGKKKGGHGSGLGQDGSSVVEIHVRFDDIMSRVEFRPGDLVWLRENDHLPIPDPFNSIRNRLVDQNRVDLPVLTGIVENAGRGYINMAVRCSQAERPRMEQVLSTKR